jgi:hypothetical protein
MDEVDIYIPEDVSEDDVKVIEGILDLINQLSPEGFEALIDVIDQIDAYEPESEEQFE